MVGQSAHTGIDRETEQTELEGSDCLISLGLTRLKHVKGVVQMPPQHWQAWH